MLISAPSPFAGSVCSIPMTLLQKSSRDWLKSMTIVLAPEILANSITDSPMGVYVVQGSCNLDQFNARTCNFLIRSDPPGPKPRKVSASNVGPGTYGLLIANFAAVDESASTQVFLSSAGCPPLSASTPSSAALDQARAQVGGSLRH